MTTMRVRNHELEDLSVACLRMNLPAKWVMHEYHKDYGIDVQIELFDETGAATGLRCYAQLKATDKSEIEDVLTLDRDHFEYWAAHTDPVLLVRFYADTKSIAWCWLHDVAWHLKPMAASLSVTKYLRPWNANSTPQKISEFLSRRSICFSSRLCPPFDVLINSDVLPLEELSAICEQAQALVDHEAFRLLVGDASSAAFTISLTKDTVASSHLGMPGFVLALDESTSRDDLSALVWLLVFLNACRYDRILAARPLGRKYFNTLWHVASGGLQFQLVDSLVYALGMEEALGILDTSRAAEDRVEIEMLKYAVVFAAAQRYGESAEWINYLHTLLANAKSPQDQGTAAYNLGNALSNSGKNDAALEMFRLTAKYLPEYLGREYFRDEIGAVLFELGQFEEAAEHYQEANRLEPTARRSFLLSDVFLGNGDYSSALASVLKAIDEGLEDSFVRQALLIREVCLDMVKRFGIDKAQKDTAPDGGISLLRGYKGSSLDDLTGFLQPLLARFGGDGLFNFNAGHTALSNGFPELAMYRFVHCALLQRWDAEAWALSIGSALKAQDTMFAVTSITTGYFFVHESLIAKFLTVCQPVGLDPAAHKKWKDGFIDLVRSAVKETSRRKPITVRIHGKNTTRILEYNHSDNSPETK